MAYRIEFDEEVSTTRNRKRLRPNAIATWELRVGDLRVFYEAVHDDGPVVRVIAVGRKRRNAVIIGDKEYKREAEQKED